MACTSAQLLGVTAVSQGQLVLSTCIHILAWRTQAVTVCSVEWSMLQRMAQDEGKMRLPAATVLTREDSNSVIYMLPCWNRTSPSHKQHTGGGTSMC